MGKTTSETETMYRLARGLLTILTLFLHTSLRLYLSPGRRIQTNAEPLQQSTNIHLSHSGNKSAFPRSFAISGATV